MTEDIIKVSRAVATQAGMDKAIEYATKFPESIPCGKTTAHALHKITLAVACPEFPVKIESEKFGGSVLHSGGLFDTIENFVEKLGLNYIEISRKSGTITYYPYKYLMKGWEVLGHKPPK